MSILERGSGGGGRASAVSQAAGDERLPGDRPRGAGVDTRTGRRRQSDSFPVCRAGEVASVSRCFRFLPPLKSEAAVAGVLARVRRPELMTDTSSRFDESGFSNKEDSNKVEVRPETVVASVTPDRKNNMGPRDERRPAILTTNALQH